MVQEAKDATQQAQESAKNVEKQLVIDEDMGIEDISKKSLVESKKIEMESQELFEKRKSWYYSWPTI